MTRRGLIGSILLVVVLVGVGVALVLWKKSALAQSAAAAASQPEPMETVTAAVATQKEHRRTTTSIGTILAIRSITLRNELPGKVREVKLTPGQIVEEGTVLVALDTSVEEAELKAQQATVKLAEATLDRFTKASQTNAVSDLEVDRARAERDVALAQIARTQAIIDRKTIRAPFKARIGLSDVHPGQYLEEGSQLTTLQGVDDAVHVDFSVPQRVSMALKVGDAIEVSTGSDAGPLPAKVVAIDAKIDPNTRNALIRARIERGADAPAPGASVRVRVPVGPPRMVVFIPANALRKGPAGDHVFVITPDKAGHPRAHMRVVQSGAILGDEVLIHAGLEVGEQVAASGSFKLREGVLVAIANPPAGVVSGAK
jgi:membrane fusion protein (multidrug efflux system)